MKAIIRFDKKPFSKQHGHKAFSNKSTGRIQFYSTAEYQGFKDDLRWESIIQLRRQGWARVEDMPVWISVVFKASKNLGDISNLIGGIEDALNGMAWIDDCQAILKSCYGMMRNETKTEIIITLETFEAGDPGSQQIINWVQNGLKKRRKLSAKI